MPTGAREGRGRGPCPWRKRNSAWRTLRGFLKTSPPRGDPAAFEAAGGKSRALVRRVLRFSGRAAAPDRGQTGCRVYPARVGVRPPIPSYPDVGISSQKRDRRRRESGGGARIWLTAAAADTALTHGAGPPQWTGPRERRPGHDPEGNRRPMDLGISTTPRLQERPRTSPPCLRN